MDKSKSIQEYIEAVKRRNMNKSFEPDVWRDIKQKQFINMDEWAREMTILTEKEKLIKKIIDEKLPSILTAMSDEEWKKMQNALNKEDKISGENEEAVLINEIYQLLYARLNAKGIDELETIWKDICKEICMNSKEKEKDIGKEPGE